MKQRIIRRNIQQSHPVVSYNVPMIINIQIPFSLQRYQWKKKKQQQRRKRRMTQVMTCTTLPPSSSNTMEQPQPQQQLPQVVRIYVKPLIILDLNGVLCHRVRTRNSPFPKNEYHKWYRPSIGRIAMTPIIARNDLTTFLEQLCQNFTMAVWTSAKRRNALELVKLLFPPHISQQLLFIWAQNKCQSIPRPNKQPQQPLSNQYKDDIIFTKRLSKVWEDYPLWNSTNTLLIDDSPDKCPNEYVNNALHPPPLTGLKPNQFDSSTNTNNNKSSTQALMNDNNDEINEELQRKFFHKLAMHWTTNPTNDSPQNNNHNDETIDDVDHSFLRSFLKRHGSSHMGWRGETKLQS